MLSCVMISLRFVDNYRFCFSTQTGKATSSLTSLIIFFRIRRWCLQPLVDNERVYTDIPFLERDQKGSVSAIKCVPHVHYPPLVEHCKRLLTTLILCGLHYNYDFFCRYPGSQGRPNPDILSKHNRNN
jgi:hypothetical protein